MEHIARINAAINSVVWGTPMLVLLLGTGLFLTIRTGGVQFRRFGCAMKHTVGRMFRKTTQRNGAVSPFQAVTTALAATMGTGNIAGITWAVTLGGPGTIFWLWVSALIGMGTKYAEVVLAVRYRERNAQGDWVGGPMYYISNGWGRKRAAVVFSAFGALAAFGIGNAVQVGNITDAVGTAVSVCCPNPPDSGTLKYLVGGITAVVTAVTLLGGIQRLGRVTEKLVPLMSLVYLAACLTVLICHAGKLPEALAMIFKGAFSPSAVVGGAGGIRMKLCVEWGIKRGIFSNEAGLGSAPMAHAATSETDPVKQGFYGIFEVFTATLVLCTVTGLTLLVSGIDLHYGTKGTTALNAQALATVFGSEIGALVISASIILFALSSILTWGLYGTRCCEFLFGTRFNRVYQMLFSAVVMVGAVMDLGLAWDVADTLNGLMAIPNLIALLGLSGVVAGLTRDHFGAADKDRCG